LHRAASCEKCRTEHPHQNLFHHWLKGLIS
jgi:hypothetical protein